MTQAMSHLDPAREFVRWGGNVLLYGRPGTPMRHDMDLLIRGATSVRQLRRPPNERWSPARLDDLATLLAGIAPAELEAVAGEDRHVLIDVLRKGSAGPSVFTVGRAVTGLVRELVRQQPLMLVVDELHHLDRATTDVLAQVVGALNGRRGFQVVAAEEVRGNERPWGKRLLPAPQLVVHVDPPRHLTPAVTL